jgi:homoserine kinase
VLVRVPASSANLGPAFDALGLALDLHLEVGFVTGAAGEPAAADDHHPTTVAFRHLHGRGPLWVRSPIPSGRGLGFSGAARIGGLLAAVVQRDGIAGVDAAATEVLEIATELEGHADNVAASLLGGIVATAGGRAVPIPLAFDPTVVVWVPRTTTATDESRRRIHRPIPFDDAVFNVGRTALLVAALAAGDVDSLRYATEDRLHQDIRFERAPESRAALDAGLAVGAWCGWLSGSGPTVAMLCAHHLSAAIVAALPDGGSAKVLRIDHAGASVEAG